MVIISQKYPQFVQNGRQTIVAKQFTIEAICDVVPHQIIRASEMSHLPWIRYFHLNPDELAVALNLKGNAQIAKQYIDSFPKVSIQYMVQPITEQFLRIQVE